MYVSREERFDDSGRAMEVVIIHASMAACQAGSEREKADPFFDARYSLRGREGWLYIQGWLR